LPPIDILTRSVTIKGIGIGPRTSFEDLLTAMAVRKVRPVTDNAFADHAEAYRRLESGHHIGKVIIDVAG
jgi:D-arabinose 1-dehydrogenase-like Zn-dependent alcohol dehydrogenase